MSPEMWDLVESARERVCEPERGGTFNHQIVTPAGFLPSCRMCGRTVREIAERAA